MKALLLHGAVSHDMITRISYRVSSSVRRFTIIYDSTTISITFLDVPTSILIEDINSIFSSVNIPE